MKELWAQAKDTAQSRKKRLLIDGNDANADHLNQYFAEISTDPDYNLQEITQFYRDIHSHSRSSDIHGYQVEPILRQVKNTAPGCDNLPARLFVKCSVELANMVAKLLNMSLASGQVNANWKTAFVTPVQSPVPKVAHSASPVDFRPIGLSVTPILQRKFV